jgi:hypothetical protein
MKPTPRVFDYGLAILSGSATSMPAEANSARSSDRRHMQAFEFRFLEYGMSFGEKELANGVSAPS